LLARAVGDRRTQECALNGLSSADAASKDPRGPARSALAGG
jgi:hypothetical protein